MTELILTCVIWSWLPGANNTHYEFYGNDVLIAATTENQAQACVPGHMIPVTYYVVGLDDAGNRSEPSNSVTAQYIGSHDADLNGVVGFSDFASFSKSFGKCNDGRKVVPCP